MLSEPSDELQEALGDITGDYGTDFISPFEYGELLLMNEEGKIERTYPMTSFPPSWLLVTGDAVYVGRIGDGALPWSAIGRIDRTSFEGQFIIFPIADAQYEYWPPGWTFVPDDYDQPLIYWPSDPTFASEDYDRALIAMNTPPTDSFSPADSWMGNVHINVEEVEELFASE